MRIKSKQQFYELYNARLLGNKLRTYATLEELEAAVLRSRTPGKGMPGDELVSARYTSIGEPLIMARQNGKHGGGYWGVCRADKMRRMLRRAGLKPEECQYNECAPDHVNTLQGEVWEAPGGFELFAALHTGLRMRDALLQARMYSGLEAAMLVRGHFSPASYDDLRELFDEYPGAVVEFCAYAKELGWARGRNVIIWEVRHY